MMNYPIVNPTVQRDVVADVNLLDQPASSQVKGTGESQRRIPVPLYDPITHVSLPIIWSGQVSPGRLIVPFFRPQLFFSAGATEEDEQDACRPVPCTGTTLHERGKASGPSPRNKRCAQPAVTISCVGANGRMRPFT
jgi:hypothetical protein